MRNIVIDTVELSDAFKPLATERLIATVTLIGSSKNTDEVQIQGGDGKEATLPMGVPIRFEQIDLSQIQAKGKSGESLYVFGNTSG